MAIVPDAAAQEAQDEGQGAQLQDPSGYGPRSFHCASELRVTFSITLHINVIITGDYIYYRYYIFQYIFRLCEFRFVFCLQNTIT